MKLIPGLNPRSKQKVKITLLQTTAKNPRTITREGLNLRGWLGLCLASALAVLFLYHHDVLFYDGIYYLRSVTNPHYHHFTFQRYDRWTHVNFVWALVKISGGPSAFTFELVRWVYRALMALDIFIWWKVFERFFPEQSLKRWGLLLLATSPLSIYNASQILPEQWALLFTGLAAWIYFQGLENRNLLLYPLAGVLFYLGFLSRSDSLLLPGALCLSCFVWGYRPRRDQAIAAAGVLLIFLPLLADHLRVVGFNQVAPMARAMWNYKMPSWSDNFLKSLMEFGRGAGLFIPFSFFAVTRKELRDSKEIKILATASTFVYSLFLFWIASGHFGYGRHTLQGAVLLAALGTYGFTAALRLHEDRQDPKTLYYLYAALALYFVSITGGRLAVPLSAVLSGCVAATLLFSFLEKKWQWPVKQILPLLAAGTIGTAYLALRWPRVGQSVKDFIPLAFAAVVFWGLSLLSALKTPGRERPVFFFFAACLFFHVGLANTATGGVNIQSARGIFEKAKSDGLPVLVADDPTFYFYQFYYGGAKSNHVFLCFSGGEKSEEAYYRRELKKTLGEDYLAAMPEVKGLKAGEFVFLGDPNLTWLSSEKEVTFEPLPSYGIYKGQPIRKVRVSL